MLLNEKYMYNGEIYELVVADIDEDIGIIRKLEKDHPVPNMAVTRVVMLSLEFILKELEKVPS
jgi:hypothetical protein